MFIYVGKAKSESVGCKPSDILIGLCYRSCVMHGMYDAWCVGGAEITTMACFVHRIRVFVSKSPTFAQLQTMYCVCILMESDDDICLH